MLKISNINPEIKSFQKGKFDLERISDSYLLAYVKEGEFKLSVGMENFEVEKNDIIFLRPKQDFSIVSKGNVEVYSIQFDFFDFDRDFLFQKSEDFMLFNKVSLKEVNKIQNSYRIQNSFYDLFEEYNSGSFLSSYIVKNSFATLLLKIMRNVKKMKGKKKNTYLNILSDLKSYILKNIDLNLTLEELSDYVQINKWHLVRIFNSYYNITPIKFFSDLRLERAKELIEYTDLSIGEISKKMNFESQQSFTRWFKNNDGKTPTYYRKR